MGAREPACINDDDSGNGSEFQVLATYQCDQFGATLSDYRTGLRQSWHHHQQPILTLILAGYAREQVSRHDVVINPLDVGLKPAELRHTDHFWPHGVRAVRIELARSLFSQIGIEPQLERWDWITGSMAVRPLLRVAERLHFGGGNTDEVADHVFEAVAALSPAPPRSTAAAPQWVIQANEHIQTSYASGIRLSHLARAAQVHPVYFARQFRRFFGCSVGRYIRQLQLRSAASLIANRQLSLAEVACHVGCSDQSHLTRIFNNEFGITPGALRKLLT